MRSLMLAVLLVLAMLGVAATAAKVYDAFPAPHDPVLERGTCDSFYVATLDSLVPYTYVSPTGEFSVEAPRLDERDFFPPDSLALVLRRAGVTVQAPDEMVGGTREQYEVLGVVCARLAPLMWRMNWGRSISDERSLRVEYLRDQPRAPHGRFWAYPENVDWDKTLFDLVEAAEVLGANAVVDLYCGNQGTTPTDELLALAYMVKPQALEDPKIITLYAPLAAASGGAQPNRWVVCGVAVKSARSAGGLSTGTGSDAQGR
jgi:hypothetical protein